MAEYLWLRFDAPLLSFGAPSVDNFNIIQEHPSLAQLTGLLANALGYEHREAARTESLQARLRFATRCDRKGHKLQDFQTVALGEKHLVDTGWTTRGVPQERGGGSSKETHIRYRDYWADSVYTIALHVTPANESPTLDELARALDEPARPLFIGRKPCLPAAPILLGRTSAATLLAALAAAPRLPAKRQNLEELPAWWPDGESFQGQSQLIAVTDARDWKNQLHVGRRLLRYGMLRTAPTDNGGVV